MKKQKSIVLKVSSPCSEDWNKMTPQEKGCYCSSCQRAITDFTKYTDKQLLDFITNSDSRIYSRLNLTQLNREITSYEGGNTSFVKRLLAGAALITALAACNESTPPNTLATQTEQHISANKHADSNKQETKVPDSEVMNAQQKSSRHSTKNINTLPPLGHVDTVGNSIMIVTIASFPNSAEYKDAEDYISKNISYPKAAVDKGIKGTVYVGFTVEKSGEIDKVRILKGINAMLDSEAVRVVRTMPKWIPSMKDGKAVSRDFMVPVRFKLNDDSTRIK